ncbi:MAG TPA: phosphoglycerate mutase, partial [Bacillota bacterium]|nr:phosphoglycerate mutase [Bacillota bacterium]
RRGEHFRIMVLPDHPTPVSVRTHTMDPVPFFIYDSKAEHAGVAEFTEESCKRQPLYIPDGYRLMEYLTGRIVP